MPLPSACAGGTPEQALPTMQLQAAAAYASSFAEIVDRALSDVRQVLVVEHLRLLKEMGDISRHEALASSSFEQARHRATMSSPSPPIVAENTAAIPSSPKPRHITEVSDLANPDNKNETPAAGEFDDLADSSSKHEQPFAEDCNSKPNNDKELPGTKSWSQQDNLSSPSVGKAAPQRSTSSFLHHLSQQGTMDLKRAKTQQQQDVKQHLGERLMSRFQGNSLEKLDAIMSFVIVANAIAIGASCDTRDWTQGWLIIDTIFAVVFIGEFCIKSCLLGLRGYFCGTVWFWSFFEMALIVLSVIEIVLSLVQGDAFNGSPLLRVLRLVRLTKMLRFARMHLTSDLVMMVNGLVGGARTLLWAIVLTLFPLSIFTLVMRETLGEEGGSGFGAQSFDTLPKSAFNTFRCLVIEDCADETGRPIFVLVCEEYGWGYGFLYSLTVLFMKFGLYNVIIAIFVEQTVQAAKYNEVYQKRARLNDQIMFYEKSLEMCEVAYSLKKGIQIEQVASFLTIEEIQSLELTNEEFSDLCRHHKFKELLAALDVAEEDHLDLFDTLDVDGGGTLDLGEIVVGIGKLRGDARKSDIVAVILLAKHLSKTLADFKAQTLQQLQSQRQHLLQIRDVLQYPSQGPHGAVAEKPHGAVAENPQSHTVGEPQQLEILSPRMLIGSYYEAPQEAVAEEPKSAAAEEPPNVLEEKPRSGVAKEPLL